MDALGEMLDHQGRPIPAGCQCPLVVGQILRVGRIVPECLAQSLQHFIATAIQEDVAGFRMRPERAEQLIEK
jgi:hypothetical protein